MSPVVRVRGGTPEPAPLAEPALARTVPLSLAELVAAARLAGDVPLPFAYDDSGGRLARRLAAGDDGPDRVRAALARARPGGEAEASLAARRLVVGGRLVPEPAAALRTLAAGRTRVLVDLAERRGEGERQLHCWLGVEGRLVARLATTDGLRHELGWHDLGRWSAELARVVTLRPGPGPALPAYLSLPSELLVAAARTVADGRPDLLDALLARLPGGVVAGKRGRVRPVDGGDARALLEAVAAPTARLRVLATRGEAVVVVPWLRVGPSWHAVEPGPGATTRLRRRVPADLGPSLAAVVTGTRA